MNTKKESMIPGCVPTLFDVPNPPKPVGIKRKAPLDRTDKVLKIRKRSRLGTWDTLPAHSS